MRALLLTRVVFLLLAFVLSFMISQPVEWLLGSLAQMAPGAAGAFVYLAAILLASAAQFFATGFVFTLLSGLSWRRAALWALPGTALLNLLCEGPSALSASYFAVQLASWLGLARAVLAAAAAVGGCWYLEQREHEDWVDQSRAMILSMIGQ